MGQIHMAKVWRLRLFNLMRTIFSLITLPMLLVAFSGVAYATEGVVSVTGTTLEATTSPGFSASFNTEPKSRCTVNGEEVDCAAAWGGLKKAAGLFSGLILVFIIISVAASIFWLFMFVHAAIKPIENKALWLILLLFFNIIAAIVYYFVVKKEFDKQQIGVNLKV